MLSPSPPTAPVNPTPSLHARFLKILPRIELHARIFFRYLRCPQELQDRIAETVALAWRGFARLDARGKDAGEFIGALADFAARAVRNGRRLCGHEKPKDVLSLRAQKSHNFCVQSLPQYSPLKSNPIFEALEDNTRTAVPEQVAFRCDFPAWRSSLTSRDREIMQDLMIGDRPSEVARKFGLSRPRITQKRHYLARDWEIFTGDGELEAEQMADEVGAAA